MHKPSEPCVADFHPISLEEKNQYLALHKAANSQASDYSLGNLWGWANHYSLEWAFQSGLCWIRQNSSDPGHDNCCWAPVGPWAEIDWSKIPVASGTKVIRVPETLVQIWQQAYGDRLEVEETRGQWDYLYNSEDLATLKGNRFHKKKNHLNQFLKHYKFEYLQMSQDCVEEVLDLQEQWRQWREDNDSEALLAENDAVYRVLKYWEDLPGLTGGTIRIDGHLVAYTVAEPLTSDTMVIHFEKGKSEFRGIYQAINSLFAAENHMEHPIFNREQDLDDLGLRQAKESYQPSGYLKKYTVRFK